MQNKPFFTSLLLSLFLLVSQISFGQVYKKFDFQLAIGDSIKISFPFAATSMALTYEDTPEWLFWRSNAGNFQAFEEDNHNENKVSKQVIFEREMTEIWIGNKGENSQQLILHIFNAKHELRLNPQPSRKSPCSQPELIPGTFWREGLPAPEPGLRATQVAHLVTHHSATSNNLTDYTEVVRNIYLCHTQANGWSDIGYNYLIAPDGSLYEGRGHNQIATDNVMGAHFCGKNSGTMGVCIIGDYTDFPPSNEALATLQQLLAWKVMKDLLNPNGSYTHPKNSSGQLLPVLAAHRMGCATECPGNAFYQQFDDFRDETIALLDDCGYLYNQLENTIEKPALQKVANGWMISDLPTDIEVIELYDLAGRKCKEALVRQTVFIESETFTRVLVWRTNQEHFSHLILPAY